MDFSFGDSFAKLFGQVLDRVWPDPNQKAQAALELAKLQQEGAFKEIDDAFQRAKLQTDTNLEEAKNQNIFVSGWRPFIGWVCGSAFAWHYIGAPFLVWGASLFHSTTTMPNIELGDLFTLMLGMLGLGGMRTYEKLNGASNGH